MTSSTTRAASAGDRPVLVAMRSTRSRSASGRDRVGTALIVRDTRPICNFLPDIGQERLINPQLRVGGAEGVRLAGFGALRWRMQAHFSEDVTPRVGVRYLW